MLIIMTDSIVNHTIQMLFLIVLYFKSSIFGSQILHLFHKRKYN